MGTLPKDAYAVACGRRLTIARLVLGFPIRRSFARATMPSEDDAALRRAEDKLRKYEEGTALVPPSYIDQLKTLFGITQDYIFSNDKAGMPADLAVRITKAEQDHIAL